MNILMIGNGFDLEHGLPTRYADFLDFVEAFNNAYDVINSGLANPNYISQNDYVNKIFESDLLEYKVNALRAFTKGNIWINHFQAVYKQHLSDKQNWIDFESEMSSIVQDFDLFSDPKRNKLIDRMTYHKKFAKFFGEDVQQERIKTYIEKMVNDLNRLICALEIYIEGYVNKMVIPYLNPDIATKYFDKIISFNYSNTYERLYDEKHYSEYDFVHGKAYNNISFFPSEDEKKIYESIIKIAEINNMVLGIDEYLREEETNKNLKFIQIKKYYQRIYKRTGNKYKDWLEEMKLDRYNYLYIFGHSLDITDGDILRDFILRSEFQTVIYYKDKKQLEQQIINLVKILGKDTVIYKTYGEKPDILFRQQKIRECNTGDTYQIERDMILLKKSCINNVFMEKKQILTKILDNIQIEELKYFRFQENVIALYELIQELRLPLEDFNEKKLLEIAYQLSPYKELPPKCDWDKYASEKIMQFITKIDRENKKRQYRY